MRRPGHPSTCAALASLFAGALGCAPRVATLVEHKHYREAICAAHDGGARRRDRVSEALANDTGLYLHVERLEAAELAPIVGSGATAAALLERVHLVRIRARTNTLPIDDLGFDLSIQGDQQGAAAAPLAWETLAFATGEPIPGPRRYETYATLGNALRAVGAVVTVGMSLPFTRWGKRTVEMPAPLETYEQQMPVAAALMRGLGLARCEGAGLSPRDGDAGLSCVGYFVFDRSPGTRWSLVLTTLYVAGRGTPPDPTCTYHRVTSVEIGTADEWSGRFGPRMREVGELREQVLETRWKRTDR
jgi:hypothetical protein